MPATARKPAVNFILLTVLIDVISFGIIIPVLPQLLADMEQVDINEASKYGGYLLTAFAVAQFIFSPIMGALSDQYGRRPLLLLSLFGLSIDYLILALAPSFTWFLAGRILAGICGASFTTASAYIADVSTQENRAKNFGLIGAAFGLGFIIGPLLGGVFGQIGVRVPFYGRGRPGFRQFRVRIFYLAGVVTGRPPPRLQLGASQPGRDAQAALRVPGNRPDADRVFPA